MIRIHKTAVTGNEAKFLQKYLLIERASSKSSEYIELYSLSVVT